MHGNKFTNVVLYHKENMTRRTAQAYVTSAVVSNQTNKYKKKPKAMLIIIKPNQ